MNQPPDEYGQASWAALTSTSTAFVITDATRPDNPVSYANPAFSALCGYGEAEILGQNGRFLQGPQTDERVCAEIRAAVAAGTAIRRAILNYRKDGTPFWNDMTIDPIRDPAGRLTGFIGSHREVKDAERAAANGIDLQPTLDSIASNIPGYIYRRVLRTDGTIDLVYCSPSLAKMLGIDRTDGWRSFFHQVHPDDRAALIAAIHNSADNLSMFREEYRLLSPSGVVHWLRSDAPPRRMDNGDVIWDGLAVEISAEKQWQQEIATLALRDPLTALLTREAWRQALAVRLNTGHDDGLRCALIYVDIEAFRTLNNRLVQRAADDILREVGQRLATIAESVGGVAARLGGDEFAILVPDCPDESNLSQVADEVGAGLARPMEIDGQRLTIRTYIGATLRADGQGDDAPDMDVAAELMTQAELALRWAKLAGGNGHIVYSAAQDDRFRNQGILARSLECAIADGELELHYQPLVDLATGRIVSAEALVRWNHPTLGMQRPDLFIPLAEKLGLIAPLGRWVLRQAVQQRKLWQDAGLAPPPIAINVSGRQLMEPGFARYFANVMTRLAADPANFEIELTEGELIEASPQVMASLHALREMGFTITIDDFGSGHATFRYLRDFPVHKIKIDQIFVRKLVLDSNDALIIRAIISLARSMGLKFVAEGIETEMQRDFLQREGCETGQGYLFSMPLVAEDFAWLLENDVTLPRAAAEPLAEASDSSPEPYTGTGG